MSASKLHATLGVVELGAFVASVLFGVMCVQAFYYYMSSSFKTDKWWLKCLVAVICLLETMHTALAWHYVYDLSVIDFGNYDEVQKVTLSSVLAEGVTLVILVLIQSFYAYRSHALSQKLLIPLTIWALLFTFMALGVATVVIACNTFLFNIFATKYVWIPVTSVAIFAVADILNTANLCYILWRARTEHSCHIIEKLITWTLESGFITTSLTIATVICLAVMPNNLIWIAIIEFKVKVYSNAFLATLNGRSVLRAGQYDRATGISIVFSTRPVSEIVFQKTKTAQTTQDAVSDDSGSDDTQSVSNLSEKHDSIEEMKSRCDDPLETEETV